MIRFPIRLLGALLVALVLAAVLAVAPPAPVAAAPAVGAVGIASTPDGKGYITATADGRVSAAGTAVHVGDLAGAALNRPIVGVVATATGKGYWLVGADGGVFAFGDAPFWGSTGNLALNKPVVSLAPTPSGNGYWMVASDGGVFAFGDARFAGSMGGTALNQPVNGMTPSPTGRGYRLIASDGGVFSFGDAPFHGSAGGERLGGAVVGMAPAPGNQGYWLLLADGKVRPYGAAAHLGETAGRRAVGLASHPTLPGYRVLYADGSTLGFGSAPGPDVVQRVGAYKFLVEQDGQPGRWDPCRPIRVAVALNGLGEPGRLVVDEALRRVSRESGLTFVHAGEIPLPADVRKPPPGADALVSFPRLDQWPEMGSAIGKGGPRYYVTSSAPVFIGGFAAVRSDSPGFRTDFSRTGLGTVLLHELAHMVGLGHVEDPAELMYPQLRDQVGFGNGDRQGLRLVGRTGPCPASESGPQDDTEPRGASVQITITD